MTNTVNLVREVDSYKQQMRLDIFEWSGSADAPAGWKVRVVAYDGRSPMPSIFELLPGAKNEKATVPLLKEAVKKKRADGWDDKLPAAAQARVDTRVAAERDAEAKRENEIARREKAFPSSAKDKILAAAIANPTKARELDLRGGPDDRLTVIPKTIKKLTALEVLRADDNGLLDLPEEIGGCKALRELYLAGNAIRRVSPLTIRQLKSLTVLDLQRNELQEIYARSSVPMRFEIAGNPLEAAEGGFLTRSSLGDFRKLSHVGADTDHFFPIDFSYFEQQFPGVKALPTESVTLYGRKPTADELVTLAKLLPKAKVEHRATIGTTSGPAPSASKKDGKQGKKKEEPVTTAAPPARRRTRKPHADQAKEQARLGGVAKKKKIDLATFEEHARPCVDIFTKAPAKAKGKPGASRFGGAPDMPRDVAWPASSAGPMMFVAQLDCAELAPFDPRGLLPEAGLLVFFAGGFDEGALLYFAPDAKLAPRAQPKEAMFGPLRARPAPPCALTMKGAISLPQEIEEDEEDWGDLCEASIREKDDEAPHRVLCHTMGDVEEPPNDDFVLLALRSDKNPKFDWGDWGTLYFTIEEDALRERRWADLELRSTD
jgi:hypothetical protein